MKKLFYLFFFSSCLSAQACKSDKPFDKSAYYELIEQAENHIIMNEYAKAAKKYENCYELNDNMFGVDLYNALLCNVYLKKWIACEFWSTKLINKGVKIGFFNSKPFIDFKKTKEWSHIEKKYLDNKSIINTGYKRELDSLLIEDQKIYCSIPTGDITYNKAKEKTETVEEKFIILINKYGYPTEEKVGLHIYNDTIISFVPTFDALIRHGYQSNNSKLLEIFNKSLENGEMDQRIGKAILNDDFNFLVYKGSLYKMKSKFMEEDLSRERKLKFININKHKGFLIFAKFATIGNFDSSTDVDNFFKMYDLFISKWNGSE